MRAVELPASYMVWASSPEADFIKGKFVWVHWDVKELRALLEKNADQKGFLNSGVQAMPNVGL